MKSSVWPPENVQKNSGFPFWNSERIKVAITMLGNQLDFSKGVLEVEKSKNGTLEFCAEKFPQRML